jgi:hypothetical protein
MGRRCPGTSAFPGAPAPPTGQRHITAPCSSTPERPSTSCFAPRFRRCGLRQNP